ncbi:hypothetical protein KFE25_002627 [Diacronema lutheri]|uniref:Uncharacterized protein n=1 Tax=Diacronema lutheri TaxID=2081491 RepID=A0A8J6CD00_DIALT|nr:hypothetical protein KFE25_002627 [Diacronema lutheri]
MAMAGGAESWVARALAWAWWLLRWLGQPPPLSRRADTHTATVVASDGEPIGCLLLDGCNLPLSLRAGEQPSLVSRAGGRDEDWSALLAAVAGAPPRPFAAARVLFDGHSGAGRLLGEQHVQLSAAVEVSATHAGRFADDVLVDLVTTRAREHAASCADAPTTARDALASLDGAGAGSPADARHGQKSTVTRSARADVWFVVRRVGGGERAYARLWRRLGLTRTEACASLLPLSASLRAQARVDARELGASASRFVAVSARSRRQLHTVVATNDVLLARRVCDAGGAALTWRQLRALCTPPAALGGGR